MNFNNIDKDTALVNLVLAIFKQWENDNCPPFASNYFTLYCLFAGINSASMISRCRTLYKHEPVLYDPNVYFYNNATSSLDLLENATIITEQDEKTEARKQYLREWYKTKKNEKKYWSFVELKRCGITYTDYSMYAQNVYARNRWSLSNVLKDIERRKGNNSDV